MEEEKIEPIFIDCVGKMYSRCDKRLRGQCPIPNLCYRETSAKLSKVPHRKFLYLHPKRIWGHGLVSEHIDSIDKFAVFLEIEK